MLHGTSLGVILPAKPSLLIRNSIRFILDGESSLGRCRSISVLDLERDSGFSLLVALFLLPVNLLAIIYEDDLVRVVNNF